ncbi:MAG: glycosidase, partial [Phycisphaerae bacterium]
IMRGTKWLMSPEAEYERVGDVGDVVFPCGYTLADDGDGLNLYYGAADTSIALATGSVRRMVDWLKDNHTVGGKAND